MRPWCQSLRHFVGGLIAIIGVLGHHLVDDGNHFGRYVLPQGADWLGLARLMPDELLRHGAVTERRFAGQAIIERRAETVDVGADIDIMAVQRLLRREIIRRAQDVFVILLRKHVVLIVEEACQPHVENFHRAAAIDNQITWLDVAVH